MTVSGVPRHLLRLEGAAILAVCTLLYAFSGASDWWTYVAVFLLPDLSFVAYFAGSRAGAVAYNVTHSLVGPILLGVASMFTATAVATSLAYVWAAHVGFDRMLGYGLKYGSGFHDTHLGRIGREDTAPSERLPRF